MSSSGELHVAVTNPAPDLPVHLRQGDNLYTNSIVALDVRTGTLSWYRQLIANDSHDWDVTHASPLFNATIDGAAAPRRRDRGQGRHAPRDRSRLEAHPVRIGRHDARERRHAVGLTPIRACPGVLGGVEWNGPAFNPATNLLYVPAVDWCTTFTAFEQFRHIPGKLYMGGDTTMDPPSKAQGWVTAVDAATGAIKWKHRSPRPMVAAVTTTGGNVLFTGELTGDFLALDARTGRRALPLQHRRTHGRRRRHLRRRRTAVRRGSLGQPVELLGRSQRGRANHRRLHAGEVTGRLTATVSVTRRTCVLVTLWDTRKRTRRIAQVDCG